MPYADPVNRALPFQSGSETSRDAAIRAKDFVGAQGRKVWEWFRWQGTQGGTQREASEALGIGRPSICARVRELEMRGDLIKTAERRGGCFVYVTARDKA